MDLKAGPFCQEEDNNNKPSYTVFEVDLYKQHASNQFPWEAEWLQKLTDSDRFRVQ